MIATEPYTFDWQAGVAPNDRAWLIDKPGRARSLTAHRTLAVVEPVGERVRNALTNHHGRNSGEENFVCGALGASFGRNNAGQAGHILIAPVAGADCARDSVHNGQDDGGNKLVGDAFGVRRLTPVECERLQGFPDGWTEGQSDSVRYRQLGNAVAVPVATWIGARILESHHA